MSAFGFLCVQVMSWMRDRVQAEARRAAGWTTTGLAFTIPIWVVADSLLVGLLIACWAASGEWREKLRRVASSPVSVSAIVLFVWLLLGTLWGEGALEERALWVKKYANLLLIPLLISMAIDAQERRRAILALAASLVVTLILSFALSVGILPTGGLINCDPFNPCLLKKQVPCDPSIPCVPANYPPVCDPSNPCILKKHTTHNLLMAFGVLLFGVLGWKSSSRGAQWGWATASCLAAGNVLLMVQGRTGYMVLAGLAMVAFQMYFGWRGMVAAAIALSVTFSAAYQISASFHDRVNLVATGVAQWSSQVAAEDPVGQRLEFYYHTVQVIRDHPLMGAGTGGFAQAYAVYAKQAGVPVPSHPHNQYLLIMAQVGIVGLCLLLWLFVQQWRSTPGAIDAAYGLLARGLVVTIAITCLFQPALNDHTEKLFYSLFSGLLYSGIDPQPDART
jgi:O-antigen ligase